MIDYTGQSHRGQPVYILREDKPQKSWGAFGGGLVVLILLLLLAAPMIYYLWTRYTEETPKEEPKEKEKPKTHGLDGRSYEDLTGEDFKGLSPDEI